MEFKLAGSAILVHRGFDSVRKVRWLNCELHSIHHTPGTVNAYILSQAFSTDSALTKMSAEATYVSFETSVGSFTVELYNSHAPKVISPLSLSKRLTWVDM
jgi:hypothetical protein